MCEKSEQICKHTPGPWVWRGKSGTLHRAGDAPYTYGDLVLAPDYEYDSGVDTKVSDADAALIAAAPELLAELKAVREQCLFDDDDGIGVSEDVVIPSDMFDRICALINKAEGRS